MRVPPARHMKTHGAGRPGAVLRRASAGRYWLDAGAAGAGAGAAFVAGAFSTAFCG